MAEQWPHMELVEAWLAGVATRRRGRTRYEGAPPYADEYVADEIAALRKRVAGLEKALRAALPGLFDLVSQQCPDPEVRERDISALASARTALNPEEASGG